MCNEAAGKRILKHDIYKKGVFSNITVTRRVRGLKKYVKGFSDHVKYQDQYQSRFGHVHLSVCVSCSTC